VQASILGSREKHVKAGDSIILTCELRENVGKPEFVFWYHNNTMINFQVYSTPRQAQGALYKPSLITKKDT
jgi:hypothetical protein